MQKSPSELIDLAKTGNLSCFKKWLHGRHEIGTWQDRHGNFLVHHAVEGRNFDVVAYLLDNGVSAITPGEKGATPLHYAAARGDVNMLRLLLRAENMVMPINQNAMTPLHVAAGEGHLDVVRLLISRGARLDYKARLGRLPIHFAAGTNQLDVVKFLSALDPAFLEAPDDFGMRPLHWACYFGALDAVTWLLEQGATVNVSDVYGRLPGTFARNATCSRMKDVVGVLPGWSLKLKYTALQEAVLAGGTDRLRRMLGDSDDMRQCDAFGRTPLHLAALSGNRGIFDLLCESGVSTQKRDDYGWKPWTLLSFRRARN